MESEKKITDEELKQGLGAIVEHLRSQPATEPKMYFTYPERNDFTSAHLVKWFDSMEIYKWQARKWEEQEQGFTCCVDRAYRNYIRPECQKMFEYLSQKG